MNASLAHIDSIGLVGIEGHRVRVEAHVGRGLVKFTLVGLPDASLREAKDRVRSALQSCNLEVMDAHITVNLSPAGLPKSGSGFDLAIAIAVLQAAGSLKRQAFVGAALLGELALDGSIQSIRGILPAVLSAKKLGIQRVIVPASCVLEARLVHGIDVIGFDHLADLVTWAGGDALRPKTPIPIQEALPTERVTESVVALSDLADVRGQDGAVDALEVAAAGGHHVLLIGEAGSGKSMLASRMPTILPPMDDQTALIASALHSIAGRLEDHTTLMRTPPFQSPHHSVTMPALIGGGSGIAMPGAASLAHGGVLFLDEATEFIPSVLDALRQPLEEGVITIHRAKGHTTYPARFQLILASNPCPCGGGTKARPCRCTSIQKRRYITRLSGPLLDRIDITIAMRAPTRAQLNASKRRTSEEVAERVLAARDRARTRLEGTGWTLNCQLPGPWLRQHSGIARTYIDRIDQGVDRGILSMRGADRVLRLMWTLADLDERSTPNDTDLAQALQLRNSGALDAFYQ